MKLFLALVASGVHRSIQPVRRKVLFIVVTVFSFLFLFSLPILAVPENTLAFQISITRWLDVAILLGLSALISLSIILCIEKRRCCAFKKKRTLTSLGIGGTSTIGVTLTALLATAACSSCLVAVLGIFGLSTGAAFALLEYRWLAISILFFISSGLIVWMALDIAQGARAVPSSRRNS